MSNEKRVSDYIPDTEILAQMGEEFAEDAQAALKLRRALDSTNPTPKSVGECLDNLIEEYADVLVCLTVFAEALGIDFDGMMDQIGDIGVAKLERWISRLQEREEKKDG